VNASGNLFVVTKVIILVDIAFLVFAQLRFEKVLVTNVYDC